MWKRCIILIHYSCFETDKHAVMQLRICKKTVYRALSKKDVYKEREGGYIVNTQACKLKEKKGGSGRKRREKERGNYSVLSLFFILKEMTF